MASTTPIDLYLANVPEEYKQLLKNLRTTILEVIPGADELITYQVPTFKLNGMAVVGFAAFKNHCSFLPFSGGLLSQFKDELAGYEQTKGSLHFTPDHLIPDDLLRRMVATKLQMNATKLSGL